MKTNSSLPESQQSGNASATEKPVMHPVAAVILTIVIIFVGVIVGGYIGSILGGFGMLSASIGSLIFTIPFAGRLFRSKTVTQTGETIYNDGRGAAKAASLGFIVLGLVVGFIVGAFINFGACYKSECSPLEAGAPVFLPVASLLITVPVAVRTFRPKERGSSLEHKSSPNTQPLAPSDAVHDTTTQTQKVSPRSSRGLKLALIVVAGIALLFAPIAFFSFEPASVSPPVSRTEDEIFDKSQRAQQLVNNDINEVRAIINQHDITYFADADHDACYEINIGDKYSGQYETVCAFRKTEFFGFDGDHSSTLRDIEDTLVQRGWSAQYGASNPIERKLSQDASRQAQSQKNDATDTVTTTLIDTVAYTKDDLVLHIYDAEKMQQLGYAIERAQEVSGAFSTSDSKSSNFQDIPRLAEDVFSQHQFMLVISIENEYYQSY